MSELVRAIAKKLEDPHTVQSAFERSLEGLEGNPALHAVHSRINWFSLNGFAGTALLHAELASRGEAPVDIALLHYRAASHVPVNAPIGLHGGVAGLGLSAYLAYERGLPTKGIVSSAIKYVLSNLEWIKRALRDAEHGLPMTAADVVSGLSGVGAFLVTASSFDPRAGDAAEELCISLCTSSLSESDDGPIWAVRTPPGFDFDRKSDVSKLRRADAGAAHGLGGMISFLSLMLLSGRGNSVVSTVLASLIKEIKWFRFDGEWSGPVSVADFRAGQRAEVQPGTWCYGPVGISGALKLAGRALQDPTVSELAQSSLSHSSIVGTSACVCHGASSYLAVASAFEDDALDCLMAEARKRIEYLYDDALPVGFQYRTLEPGVALSEPGMLNGASGIGLSLLADVKPVDVDWRRALLLK